MAEGKKSFILYADLIHTVKKMKSAKAGELFLTILQYVNDENPIVEDEVVDLVFEGIKHQMKRDLQKWEERAERSRNNGKGGGRPKKDDNLEEPEKTQQVILEPGKPDTVNGNVTVNVNDNVKGRYIKPTITEIKEYCLERKNKVDADRFFNHYESNGWMVGKNKMKDWKAAVRTWEKNEFNSPVPVNTNLPKRLVPEPDYRNNGK